MDNKKAYIGNIAQLGGVRHYELTEGRARGMRAADIDTGAGLRYTVLLDRGMDISLASFKGRNLCYLTFNGETAPAFYEPQGAGWLNTFAGGLLTTCGLGNVSAPCNDKGEELGLHGRYSTTPATRFADLSHWAGSEYICQVKGIMESGRLFGECLTLEREITSACGSNKIRITDKVTNTGPRPAPFNILYHINLGWPLLSPSAELVIDPASTEPIDAHSAKDIDTLRQFIEPAAGFSEQLYFHTMPENKICEATLKNPELGMSLTVRIDTAKLPYISQWKMMGRGEYVLGIEPGNVPSRPRTWLREKGLLPYLAPGESYDTWVEFLLS